MFEFGRGGPQRGRFRVWISRPSTAPVTVNAGTNYFAFTLGLYTFNAVEAGGPCAGCTVPAQIVWNEAVLRSLIAPPVVITNPGLGSNVVTIFGGGSIPSGATTTQPASWGALKALYR